MNEFLPKIRPVPVIECIKISSSIENIFSCFSQHSNAAFLNSSLKTDASRFSFIGLDPLFSLENRHLGDTVISFDGQEFTAGKDPFLVLDDIIKKYSVTNTTHFPFIAGGIGYFGYGLKDWLESLPSSSKDDLSLPDMRFTVYRTILIHDKEEPDKLYISVLDTLSGKQDKISSIISNITNTIGQASGKDLNAEKIGTPHKSGDFVSNFSKPDYIAAINKALEYIKAGDIYQVCLSQRFKSKWLRSPHELYLKLNSINPSPFSAFLDYGDFQIISSSPELFLKSSNGNIETRPMKGTRPRGKTPEEDAAMMEELTKSAKDTAELLMIVDLERNDLGRTAITGSVKVAEQRRLESYPTVFQTISVIKGLLDKKFSMIDALKNSFPGGSITGCPKIRAMEIIDELEPTARGIYTGCMGYISFHETLNLNIAIRTVIMKEKDVYFQVGSGIVSDSDPEKEYEETLHKARSFMDLFKPANNLS